LGARRAFVAQLRARARAAAQTAAHKSIGKS
jgi:hypothetical protein